MRVCFLIGGFPSYSGVSSQAALQAGELSRLGVDVELCIISAAKAIYPCMDIFDPEVLPVGVSCTFLPPLYLGVKVIGQYISFLRRARRDFDIVHFHGFPDGYVILAPIFKLLGLKLVIKMTGLGINDPHTVRTYKYGWIRSQVFRISDSVIGVSEALRSAYISAGFSENKLAAIPNGVDCGRFFPPESGTEQERIKEGLGFDKGKRIALFVGTFRTSKGIDLVLKSFQMIKDEYRDLLLVIVGPICPVCPGGKEAEKELIEEIQGYLKIVLCENEILVLGKDTDRLFLVGPTRNIECWMRACDVFLFPSRQEGMPNVVLEAMATALPCLTLKIPEVTGDLLVNDELGWCVEDRKEDFVSALVEILKNRDEGRRRGWNARNRVMEKFSIETVGMNLKRLYEKIV